MRFRRSFVLPSDILEDPGFQSKRFNVYPRKHCDEVDLRSVLNCYLWAIRVFTAPESYSGLLPLPSVSILTIFLIANSGSSDASSNANVHGGW